MSDFGVHELGREDEDPGCSGGCVVFFVVLILGAIVLACWLGPTP